MFFAAWLLYEAGQPGAPQFPDANTGDASTRDNGVTVFVPSGADLTGSSLNVAYSQSDNGSDDWTQDINLSLGVEGSSDRFPVIIELTDGARITPPSTGDPELDFVELLDRQLFRIDVGPETGWNARLDGTLIVPPVSTQNSRSAFASPAVGGHFACHELSAISANISTVTIADWSNVSSVCDSTEFERSVFLVLVTGRTPLRVDYLDVEPIESSGSPGFRWKNVGTVPTLRVRLSYVDINAEALAERWLFLSGVAVGLASATGPFAIDSLVRFRGSRRRGDMPRQQDPET